jgi:hypothetical protein
MATSQWWHSGGPDARGPGTSSDAKPADVGRGPPLGRAGGVEHRRPRRARDLDASRRERCRLRTGRRSVHDQMVRAEVQRFSGRESTPWATASWPPLNARDGRLSVPRRFDVRLGPWASSFAPACTQRGDDVAGLAVHIGARVSSLARPDEIWASSTIRDLVAGSTVDFEELGEHELKGVPGTWRLYSVNV